MRQSWFLAAFLLASSFGGCAQTAYSGGRIAGTVIDQAGQPIAGAYVMAVQTLNQSLDNPPSAKSDSNGQFEISDLPLRNYHVYAPKPEDGYPFADPFYSEENQTPIALSTERPSGSVTISIRKAGIVTLHVTDKASGMPVSARYKLSLPQRWETQGQVSQPLLIHPSTDVMLEVSAEGYKIWFYSSVSSPSQPVPLRLESGELRSLKVELEPNQRDSASTNP